MTSDNQITALPGIGSASIEQAAGDLVVPDSGLGLDPDLARVAYLTARTLVENLPTVSNGDVSPSFPIPWSEGR